jgi:DNA repair and recombination protein RAD54B
LLNQLQDIFRIHPNTPCHTHDLLECPCDGTITDRRKIDNTQGDEASNVENDSEPENSGFINASQIKPEQITKMDKAVTICSSAHTQTAFSDLVSLQYLKKKKAELAALGEWTHINCLRADARDDIHDDILRKLVWIPDTATDGKQPATHHESSRIDALLSAVDLEKVGQAVERLTVGDIPGGAVSFLFEKVSKTALQEDGDQGNLVASDDDDS